MASCSLLRASLSLVALLIGTGAYAKNVRVNCDDPSGGNSINQALAKLDKPGPHTISVAGTCNEAVVIHGFERLTLVAEPGGRINDPTPDVPDDNFVVTITHSRLVTLEGLDIFGGIHGVACFAFSSCILNGNGIHGASASSVMIGRQSSAELLGNVFENSFGGLAVTFGAHVVVFDGEMINLHATAIAVLHNSFLRIGSLGTAVAIRNNNGGGIAVTNNSTLTLQQGAVDIRGNAGTGVAVSRGSVAEIAAGNVISQNAGNGISVGDSSFVHVGTSDIAGNAQPQVVCVGTFSNAKGEFSCNTP